MKGRGNTPHFARFFNIEANPHNKMIVDFQTITLPSKEKDDEESEIKIPVYYKPKHAKAPKKRFYNPYWKGITKALGTPVGTPFLKSEFDAETGLYPHQK